MAFDRRQYAGGAVKTTLTGGTLSSGGTSIAMAAATGWPTGAGNFVIVMNRGNATEEKILCSSLSGTTITVAGSGRGYDGTSAASHLAGESIELCASSVDFDEANNLVHQVLATTTTAGDMLAASAANKLDTRIPAGTSGQVLIGGTPPSWTGSPSITALTASGLVQGGTVTATGESKGADFNVTGLTGATSGGRLVGATASAAPASGTFAVGDIVILRNGGAMICITAGTPGTWQRIEAGLIGAKGDLLVGTAAGTLTNLGVGSNTQVLTADSTQASGVKWAAPATSAMTQLARSVLGSNGTFSFTSISGSYNNLVIKGIVRSAAAATTDALQVRLNNDSGTNYQYTSIQGINATTATASSTAQAQIATASVLIGNSATANYATVVEIWIPEYAATTFNKSCSITLGSLAGNVSNGGVNMTGGSWASTAAITRVDIAAGSFGNLLTGSTLTLYGVL